MGQGWVQKIKNIYIDREREKKRLINRKEMRMAIEKR